MNEVTIENEWLTKYPPSRVGPDILGNRFESIAIPSDGVAMIIEDVDRWIDWQTKDTELTRPIDVGPVLISWGVLAIVRSWNSVSDAIINHACGEISQTIGCGADVNSRRYPHGEPRIESRVILDGGIGLLIATYFIGLHTEVKLARDIELTPRYGCLE